MKALAPFLGLLICAGCVTNAPEPTLPSTVAASSVKDFEGLHSNSGICFRPTLYAAPQKAWLDEMLVLDRAAQQHADSVSIRHDGASVILRSMSAGVVVAEKRLTQDVDYLFTPSGLEIVAKPKNVFQEHDVVTRATNRFVLRLTPAGRLILDCVQDVSGVAFATLPVPYKRHERFWCEFDNEANKAPEPTPTSVTSPADAGAAPAAVVAHL